MNLPPLYKYLDAEGAKLTLGNKTFKHAKPSDFNDVEDLTIQSIFVEDIEDALKIISDGFTDTLLDNLNSAVTCPPPMKAKVELIQATYRANPAAAEILRREKIKVGEWASDLERSRDMAERFTAEINEQMQDYRVLCATTHKDSEHMWSEYAERHKGISLRIEPSFAKGSKFQLFRPVIYREKRPSLYDRTHDFTAGVLFGDQERRIRESIERIIYTKTLKWQHESEYRLAISLRKDERPWETLPYHPEEITEMYLGCEMGITDLKEIVGLARRVNNDIKIFQAKRDSNEILYFEKFTG